MTSGVTPGSWRKASSSQPNGGNCVETRTYIGGPVEVRDSKAPTLGTLAMSRNEFDAILHSLKN